MSQKQASKRATDRNLDRRRVRSHFSSAPSLHRERPRLDFDSNTNGGRSRAAGSGSSNNPNSQNSSNGNSNSNSNPNGSSDSNGNSSNSNSNGNSSNSSGNSSSNNGNSSNSNSSPPTSSSPNPNTSSANSNASPTSETTSASPTSSTAASQPTASNQPPPPPCIFCIHDNDPRILYQGVWFLSGPGPFNTTHSTTTPGSFLTFRFNGSGIIVTGTVPQSNETSLPPTVSFTLDARAPFVTMQPLAAEPVANQPLYAMSQLSDTPHELTIKITSADTPFTFDYFVVFPQPNTTRNTAAGTSTAQSSAQSTATSEAPIDPNAMLTIKLLAALLGTVVFLLLLVILFLLFRLHRSTVPKRRRSTRSNSFVLTKNGAETILTSTESILRNNPSIMWSEWSSEYLPSPPALPVPSKFAVEKSLPSRVSASSLAPSPVPSKFATEKSLPRVSMSSLAPSSVPSKLATEKSLPFRISMSSQTPSPLYSKDSR